MELSNRSKLSIILTYDDGGEPVEGLFILKPFRKREATQLVIDYNRAKKYYNYIMSQSKKNLSKAIKKKNAKDVRDMIKKLRK
jgi:hypothetical protein